MLPLMVIYDDSRELNILCNCTDLCKIFNSRELVYAWHNFYEKE